MPTAQMAAMRPILIYGLPGLSFTIMCFWPGLLQLYFVTSGAFALGQSYLITSPAFREKAGIAPLPKPAPPKEPIEVQARVRTIEDAMKKPAEAVETPQKISFIDRAIEKAKAGYRETTENMKSSIAEARGEDTSKKAAYKAPARMTQEEIKHANEYERRRRYEESYDRQQRNEELREAYLRRKEAEIQGRKD